MSGAIFISYRRDDAKHAAGRLVDRLGRTFKKEQLFLDIDNIEPGLDFKRELSLKVQACDVLLAVIGPGWLESRDARGARRLDSPKDFVRIEIEAALARDVRVIPVLVDGARMPTEEELPQTLQPLAYRNAVRLTHERFAADAEDLTGALSRILTPSKRGAPPAARTAAPSQATEAHEWDWIGWLWIAVSVMLAVGLVPLYFYFRFTFGLELSGALPIVITAVAMVWHRGRSLTAIELFFYWLGSAITVAGVVQFLFNIMNWHPLTYGQPDGVYIGGLASLLAGIALARWWLRRR